MKRSALTLAAIAALVPASVATAPTALASSGYTVKVCDVAPYVDTPSTGRGWSTDVSGSSIYSNAAPSAWPDVCTKYRNNSANWSGTGGGYGDSTLPGSRAFLRFTAPAGSTITQVMAEEDLAVTSGSYGAAGVFTSAGRALEDQTGHLAGDGDVIQHQFAVGPPELGADGSAGLEFGGLCPADLDPAQQYCGGAGAAYSNLWITVDDPSDPTVDAAATLDVNGLATLTWAAADPQSGISAVDVTRAGQATTTQSPGCNFTGAPACEPTVSGSTTAQLAPGETATYTVTSHVVWGGSATKTVSVSRPSVPATPTPTPTPFPATPVLTPTPVPKPTPTPTPPANQSKVTLHATAKKGRKLRLSGSATGCKRTKIKLPRGTKYATVKNGRWSLTVARHRGTYRVTCGSASAKRHAG